MKTEKSNSLIGAVSTVALFTIVSRILALFREMELSSLFGTTGVSDAYLLAQSIPQTVFSIIAVGIATTYIPIYNKAKSENGTSSAESFSSNCSTLAFLGITIIVFIIELIPGFILKLFASGLSDDVMNTAVYFLRISAVSIYFIAYVNIYSSYLKIKSVFHATTLIGIPLNISLMIMYYLAYHYRIEWLAISVVISNAIQFLVIIIYVLKSGHKFRIICRPRDPYIKQMVIMAIPMIISTGFDEINVIVDKNLASSLIVAGGISVLYYANVLVSTCHSFVSMSINTVVFPQISNKIAKKEQREAHFLFRKAIHMIEFFLIPILIWIVFFSEIIISILFGRGKFNNDSIRLVSACLMFYSFSLPASGIRNIILDVYYSNNNTLIPMVNGIIAVIVNITLDFLFSRIWGLYGLAIATASATIVSTILLGVSLRKVQFQVQFSDIFGVAFLKIMAASFASTTIGKIIYEICFHVYGSVFLFIPAAIIGMFVYFAIMALLKDEEMKTVLEKLKRKRGK